MTQEQRNRIRQLRLEGWGYRRIATELCLRINTVQLFCSAHGLGGEGKFVKDNLPVWYENAGCCPVCGKRLIQRSKGRKRRFCSGRCRTAYCRMRKEPTE